MLKMQDNQPAHHRRSIRLPGYDYTQPGAYFITLNTQKGVQWFGEVYNDQVHLTPSGEMAAREWERLPNRFTGLRLDEWVIMPDHLHGILFLEEKLITVTDDCAEKVRRGESFGMPVAASIPTIIRAFKSSVTLRFRYLQRKTTLWQRGYYEHVIRDEQDLKRIREYIQDNPRRWDETHKGKVPEFCKVPDAFSGGPGRGWNKNPSPHMVPRAQQQLGCCAVMDEGHGRPIQASAISCTAVPLQM